MFTAGAGLNNVLVASGGDAARVVFVSRVSGVPSSTVLASMAMERLFDPIGFVILVAEEPSHEAILQATALFVATLHVEEDILAPGLYKQFFQRRRLRH